MRFTLAGEKLVETPDDQGGRADPAEQMRQGLVVHVRLPRDAHDHLAVASHPAWWLISALGVAIVALGLGASTAAAHASAERTAARFHEALQEA